MYNMTLKSQVLMIGMVKAKQNIATLTQD